MTYANLVSPFGMRFLIYPARIDGNLYYSNHKQHFNDLSRFALASISCDALRLNLQVDDSAPAPCPDPIFRRASLPTSLFIKVHASKATATLA